MGTMKERGVQCCATSQMARTPSWEGASKRLSNRRRGALKEVEPNQISHQVNQVNLPKIAREHGASCQQVQRSRQNFDSGTPQQTSRSKTGLPLDACELESPPPRDPIPVPPTRLGRSSSGAGRSPRSRRVDCARNTGI